MDHMTWHKHNRGFHRHRIKGCIKRLATFIFGMAGAWTTNQDLYALDSFQLPGYTKPHNHDKLYHNGGYQL